jgi:hypothetical protein
MHLLGRRQRSSALAPASCSFRIPMTVKYNSKEGWFFSSNPATTKARTLGASVSRTVGALVFQPFDKLTTTLSTQRSSTRPNFRRSAMARLVRSPWRHSPFCYR